MSQHLPEMQEESSQKSFVDVVANFVGAILILALVFGVKASRDSNQEVRPVSEPVAVAPIAKIEQPAPPPVDENLEEDLKTARKEALAAREEVEKVATRLVRIRQEVAGNDQQRVVLAMHKSLIEEDLARRRKALDTDKQDEFDVQRRIAEAEIKLDELTQQQVSLMSAPDVVEELENSPAPIAREIDEDAIHLRLKDGLVSVVPLTELMAEAQAHFSDIGRRLQSSDAVTETFGPINGYRIRVQVFKVDDLNSIHGPRAGELQRNTYDFAAEILPTSDSIGQDIELAMGTGGSVHKHLIANRRNSSAVVVWVHTDSFGEFRLLKRTLWEMGFSLAVKPLPPGINIGISPHGTKAAVQ